jgi:hypothetical protein
MRFPPRALLTTASGLEGGGNLDGVVSVGHGRLPNVANLLRFGPAPALCIFTVLCEAPRLPVPGIWMFFSPRGC